MPPRSLKQLSLRQIYKCITYGELNTEERIGLMKTGSYRSELEAFYFYIFISTTTTKRFLSIRWIACNNYAMDSKGNIKKNLFSKPASQSTVFVMANYEQKNLQKEAVCLLHIEIRSKSSKQYIKCIFIPSFKFMPFNSISN